MIMLIGTVNHPNIHMDALELTEAKKAARILVLLEGSVICCFIILNAGKILISYMMIAVILCASLQSIAKIIKQEVK
jgi:accessory gene regulator B